MEHTPIYKSKEFTRLPIADRFEYVRCLKEKRAFKKIIDDVTRDSLIKKVVRIVIDNHKKGREIAFIKDITGLTWEEANLIIEHYQEGVMKSINKKIIEIVIHNYKKGYNVPFIAEITELSEEKVNLIIQDYQNR